MSSPSDWDISRRRSKLRRSTKPPHHLNSLHHAAAVRKPPLAVSTNAMSRGVDWQRYPRPKRKEGSGRRLAGRRQISTDIAVCQLHKWFRSTLLLRVVQREHYFAHRVRIQLEREELLDSIRKRLAKMTLRKFFNALHSSGEHRNVAGAFKVLRRFGSKRMSVSAAKPFVEGQWLAYVSIRECAKRRLQQVRSAVHHIEDVWSHSSRYAYLSRLSMEHKRVLILCRHENIERRDIIRRYLWHLISTHQKFYNHRDMREAGLGTRTFPTAASSLILFDADDVTNCLAGIAPPQLTWGTGPYHPYSIEHLSGDDQTIRTFERRLFFSKRERQLLLEELDMSATASKTSRTNRDEEMEVEEEFPFAYFKGSPRSSQQTLEFSQFSLRDAHHNVRVHQDLKTPFDNFVARSNPVFLHHRMGEKGHLGGIHSLYFMNRRQQIAQGKAAVEATASEQNVVDEETLVLSPWAMEVYRHREHTTCLRAQKDLTTHLLSSKPLPTLKVNTTAVLKMGGYTDVNTAAFFNPISVSETESSQSPRRARKVRRSSDLHGHVTESALFEGQDRTKKPVAGAKVVPAVADMVTTWPHQRSRAAMGPHWVDFLNKVRLRDLVYVEAVRSNQELTDGPDGAAGDDGQGGSCSTARHFCGVFSPLLRMEGQPTPLGGEKDLGVRLCDMLAATHAPQTSPHTTAQTLVPQSSELAQANPALVESILAYHMERLLLQENVCRYRFQVNCGSILNSLYLLQG